LAKKTKRAVRKGNASTGRSRPEKTMQIEVDYKGEKEVLEGKREETKCVTS